MLHTTIQALFDGTVEQGEHRLYVVKNERDVLYVGQSVHVVNRLRGHISNQGVHEHESLLGLAIYESDPGSREWHVDLYTVDDCAEFIKTYFPYTLDETRMIDYAEDALIHSLTPLYNQQTNMKVERWSRLIKSLPADLQNRTHSVGTDIKFPPSLSPSMKERTDPLLLRAKEAREQKREALRKQTVQQEEAHERLVKSTCTICGEYESWQQANGQSCGVLELVTIITPQGCLSIPLVCRNCNNIINLLSTLEKEAERVRKVKEAIQPAETEQ